RGGAVRALPRPPAARDPRRARRRGCGSLGAGVGCLGAKRAAAGRRGAGGAARAGDDLRREAEAALVRRPIALRQRGGARAGPRCPRSGGARLGGRGAPRLQGARPRSARSAARLQVHAGRQETPATQEALTLHALGSDKANTEPAALVSRNSARPPCSSATARTMARPRPVPPSPWRVVAKRWKSRSR